MSDHKTRSVQCGTHGTVGAAFVCQHLVPNPEIPASFVEEEFDPDDPDPLALCHACDIVLEREGEWNDTATNAVGLRLVCEFCFAKLRQAHTIEP